MSELPIPDDVRRFIAEHIRSVVVLEALILMQHAPGREWHADELSRQLRVHPEWTWKELAELARRGVVRRCEGDPPRYAYDASIAAHTTIATLAELYPQRRVSVITLIFAKPADAIQSFADAFKLRKDRQDG